MITEDLISKTYIQNIVARDSKIIKDTQAQVVSTYLHRRSGNLINSLIDYHYHIEGTHFTFQTLNYLRFLDIHYRHPMVAERRNLALYNRVIWGVLYHETLPDLKNGLTKDIKETISAQLRDSDTQLELQFKE